MLSLIGKVSIAAFIVSLSFVGNVSANEWNTKQLANLKNTATPELQLMDWTKKMTASLNKKMEKQLQQIIIQAEHARVLDLKTRNMWASKNINKVLAK